MDTVIIAATLILAMGMGWSIGANDAANSLGTAVGARVLSLRQAIALITVFGLLGALLQGGHVTKTVGNGIVRLSELDAKLGDGTAARAALVATLACCLWVVLATYRQIPVSTSHSIVGAVAGVGVALHVKVAWSMLGGIFVCWVFTPLGAAILGYGLFRLLQVVLPKILPKRHYQRILTVLVVLSGCYVAYSWGANDVANAAAVLNGACILPARVSVAIGGLAIVLGIVTWGYRVIDTVGSRITHLMPLMAFAAQLASAVNVHIYTLLGVPVSTSHSIVGAILGVGLVRGVRVLNLRIMREIVVCWLATPLVSGVFSFAFFKLLARAVAP